MNATEVKVRDIDEFCKLYKINIPIKEVFEYYIETLKKSKEYKYSLEDNMACYSDLENLLQQTGESVRGYKNRCLDLIKDYILKSEAYKNMMDTSLPKNELISKDNINSLKDNEPLLSLDFKSANYSILKTFQNSQDFELGKDWYELCDFFNVHQALKNSKSFRQIVFGNTNPKRLKVFQHAKIMIIVEELKKMGCKEEEFVFISHDEIIIKFRNIDSKELFEKCGMAIRPTVFSMKKIKKNVFVKTISSDFLEYKTLHGVPGNKFYLYFKKYILEEFVDDRDLMYYNDGELCKWVEKDEPVKHKLPHYEKPKNILSLQVAMKEHSYLWAQMDEILPDLSAEEKRRIIELFINTCKVCLDSDSKCTCFKDR